MFRNFSRLLYLIKTINLLVDFAVYSKPIWLNLVIVNIFFIIIIRRICLNLHATTTVNRRLVTADITQIETIIIITKCHVLLHVFYVFLFCAPFLRK